MFGFDSGLRQMETEDAWNPSNCRYMETTVCWKYFVHVCFVFWGRLSDWCAYGERGAVTQLTASDMTHRTGPGGDEWRVPHSSQCVYSLQVCCFVFLFSLSFLLELIILNESGLLLLPSSSAPPAPSYFICPPLLFHPPLPPHPPPAPSRCVNQYSLLTHDSPHMFSAQSLHLGAEIVRMCVCSHEWVQLWCVLSLILSLSLFIFVRVLCACVCVCLKIHQACPGFLQRAAAVGSNQPPLPMSEHTNPFVYLSTCCVCVCACVCKHANPGEGPA